MKNFSALFIVILISINAISSLETDSIDGVSSLGGIHSQLMQMMTEVEKSDDGVKTITQFTGRLLEMLQELRATQKKH